MAARKRNLTDMTGRFNDPKLALTFMTAGRAHMTFRSTTTGNRFTFKISEPRNKYENTPDDFRLVSVMYGNDNNSDYTYIGFIRNGAFHYGKKSNLVQTDIRVTAFTWVYNKLAANQLPETLEIWHEGRCGKCGKRLTVPESISHGFGPECSKRFVCE